MSSFDPSDLDGLDLPDGIAETLAGLPDGIRRQVIDAIRSGDLDAANLDGMMGMAAIPPAAAPAAAVSLLAAFGRYSGGTKLEEEVMKATAKVVCAARATGSLVELVAEIDAIVHAITGLCEGLAVALPADIDPRFADTNHGGMPTGASVARAIAADEARHLVRNAAKWEACRDGAAAMAEAMAGDDIAIGDAPADNPPDTFEADVLSMLDDLPTTDDTDTRG